MGLIVLKRADRLTGQWDEGDHVEDGHQANSHISHIPHKGVGRHSSHKKHDKSQDLVGRLGGPVVPEQIGNIGPGVKKDADKSGEAEQPQDHRRKNDTELTQVIAHGRLQKIHALQPGCHALRSEEHDHRSAAADHKGVNEHTQSLQKPLLCRMADVRCSGGTGRRPGARLIGEKSPLHTIHKDGPEASCGHLPEAESLSEDPLEHAWERAYICQDHIHRDQQIEACHHRHHDIQHLDRGIPAQYDDRRQNDKDNGGVEGRNAKGIVNSGGYGVADHLADSAPAQKSGDGKQHCHHGFLPFAPSSRDKEVVYIVGRPTPVSAVERVFFFIDLSQGGLRESRGGPEKGNDPHPEDRSCASCGDGRHHSYQIAHAYPGRCGDNEGLDAGDRLLI